MRNTDLEDTFFPQLYIKQMTVKWGIYERNDSKMNTINVFY